MNTDDSISDNYQYPTSPNGSKSVSMESDDNSEQVDSLENVPGNRQRVTVEFTIRKPTPKRIHYFKRFKRIRKRPRAVQEHPYLTMRPYIMTCPNCLYCIETEVRYYNTCTTHVLALSLVPICLCLVPYRIITFKDAAHYCPQCGIYLGITFGAGKRFCPPWSSKNVY